MAGPAKPNLDVEEQKHSESYDVLENFTFDLSNAEGESFQDSNSALYMSGHEAFAREGMASAGAV